MNTAKRVIESKHAKQRSLITKNAQTKLSASTDSITKDKTTGLRSIGPVTRSLAAAARSAFSTNKNSSSQVNINSQNKNNAHSRPPLTACSVSRSCSNSDHIKQKQKSLEKNKTKLLSKEIAVSKDSVFSDENDPDINWVIASKYKFDKDNNLINNEPRKDPSYIRIAKVLSGYSPRRSNTPDSKTYDTTKDLSKFCTTSLLTKKQLKSDVDNNSNTKSHSSSEVSDNGFCEGKNELDDCSNYSFIVPEFNVDLIDGNAYKELVNSVTSLFNSHLIKCELLLENQNFLPESIAESVRVVVGRTKLLMKKRLTQFSKQLESHLNPIPGEKITTLNDLHGLWSLVDIQIGDIRQCFLDVEKSKLSGWKDTDHKLTLITTKSMPSLQIINKPILNGTNNVNHKSSVDEAAIAAKKAALEEKRLEETRRRQEFIRTQRLAISNKNNNNNNKQNGLIIL